jgi:D-lyxose ketol-isomerase
MSMKRRTLLKATALAATGPLAGLSGQLHISAADRKSTNGDFYTDGKFDEKKAKDGVLAMVRKLGYHLFPGLREKLWVSDYGTGQFSKIGLAAYLFENHYDEGGSYMMLDLFLLPGQMLPEHWHLEGDHGITKNEGWLVRWGKAYIVGAGENNLSSFPQIKIPAVHCGGTATTGHVTEATPGMFVPLAKMGTRHWQYGGPEGAIVTEVANYHTNGAVRHSDPAINRNFLG